MVGTAVYQVGFTSSSQAKKRSALKPGEHETDAPAASEESVAAMKGIEAGADRNETVDTISEACNDFLEAAVSFIVDRVLRGIGDDAVGHQRAFDLDTIVHSGVRLEGDQCAEFSAQDRE